MNHKIRKFLNATTAKTNWLPIIIIIVAFLAFSGALSGIKINLADFNIGDGGEAGVPVERALQFSAVDTYSGTAAGSKTIYVYSADGALLETLTTAATGLINTANKYKSGTQLYIKYTDSNSKLWQPVTVPNMPESELESQTYNLIAVPTFTIGTYTTDSLTQAGTAIADAGSYNSTTSGSTPIFIYRLQNTGSDNTGLMEGYDPVYQQAWQTWVVVTFSGTGYENIVLSDFDNQFTLGTTNYGCDRLSPTELTKWKVGSSYRAGYTGADEITFALDMSGYSGTAVTMQIRAYAYCDPAFASTHGGSMGQNALEIAEQTVTLTV